MQSKQSKPVVIFLPGLGARGRTYRPLLKKLSREFDIRWADHPLQLPRKLDWHFFECAVEAVAPNESFTLLGHSMGGATALHYAASNPDRVKRVVAIAPVMFPFIRKRRRYARLRAIRNSLLGGHPLHLLRALLYRIEILNPQRARALYSWAGRIDLSRQLGRLRSAVILQPQDEEIIPSEHFERIHTRYQNVKVTEIPGTHNDCALAPRRQLAPIREALHG